MIAVAIPKAGQQSFIASEHCSEKLSTAARSLLLCLILLELAASKGWNSALKSKPLIVFCTLFGSLVDELELVKSNGIALL